MDRANTERERDSSSDGVDCKLNQPNPSSEEIRRWIRKKKDEAMGRKLR